MRVFVKTQGFHPQAHTYCCADDDDRRIQCAIDLVGGIIRCVHHAMRRRADGKKDTEKHCQAPDNADAADKDELGRPNMVGVACNLDDQNEGRRYLKQNGYFAHHPGEQKIADLCGAALGCWVAHIGEMRPRPCLEQPFEPIAKREIDHGKQERYADPADAARRIVALQSPLGLTGKACSAAENILEALAKLERVSFEPFPHRPHAGSAIYGHGRGVRRFNNQNLCAGFFACLE